MKEYKFKIADKEYLASVVEQEDGGAVDESCAGSIRRTEWRESSAQLSMILLLTFVASIRSGEDIPKSPHDS